MKFGVSRNLKAFTDEAVGTKVLEGQTFLDVLETKVEQHNPAKDRAPGQHFIMCPEAVPLVSCGIGERTTNPNDYVARLYRGRVELFLKREKAAEVTGCAVVVYTRAAYLNDPDVKKEPEELARIEADQEMTHIIIAVLAFGGPLGPPPLTPTRFIANLAGSNNEVSSWTRDEILAKAAEIQAYDNLWCVVADLYCVHDQPCLCSGVHRNNKEHHPNRSCWRKRSQRCESTFTGIDPSARRTISFSPQPGVINPIVVLPSEWSHILNTHAIIRQPRKFHRTRRNYR